MIKPFIYFLLLVSFVFALAMIIKENFPALDFSLSGKELVVKKFDLNSVVLNQDDALSVSTVLYNNSKKPKEIKAGIYLIKSSKIYDSANMDYFSPSQESNIFPGDSAYLDWKLPLTVDPGKYKMLFWIHQIENGAETVLKDSWYPKEISVEESALPLSNRTLRGDMSTKSSPAYIKDIEIFPMQHLSSSGKIKANFKVANNSQNTLNAKVGIYLYQKDKIYNGINIDFASEEQNKAVYSNTEQKFSWEFDLKDLPTGDYNVLAWLHKIDVDGKEIFIEDQILPLTLKNVLK